MKMSYKFDHRSRLNRDPITQVMESRSAVLGSRSETHWELRKYRS